jgi:hypothetical protein
MSYIIIKDKDTTSELYKVQIIFDKKSTIYSVQIGEFSIVNPINFSKLKQSSTMPKYTLPNTFTGNTLIEVLNKVKEEYEEKYLIELV